jgi:outer membrane receptor protein involved in Fe transport
MRYKGLIAVSAVAIACAAQAASAQERNFDVPAQPAVTAIPTFARQAGVQIVAPAARLKGRMAQAVKGQMEVDAGLAQLLAGTGLSVAARTGQTISLRVADEAPAADASPDGEAGSAADNSIIVTGRAGTGGRTKAQTSYAVSTLSADFLRTRAPSSVTEALKSVPGFWVEASGGEASGNIRARGIPVDGFGSINLLEDGLPVQHDPALGYLNADQTFRVDESIDRVEVVRGGPSSIFASNAPGGSVNFIMRKPGDEFSGLAKYEYGPTANLNRFDGWFGGPIGDGWKFDVGGFYRTEDGVRDPGFTGNRGGQIRADLTKDFARGHVSLSFKRLDDHTILYTGIPLTKDANGDIVAVNGFGGHYGTLASPETAHLTLRDGHGGFVSYDNTDGTRVKLNQYSAMADYEIFDGWTLSNKARYRTSDTVRNGIYPSALAKATDYVGSVQNALLAAYPGATSVQLRYTDTGQAFDMANQNGNGLIVQNSARPVTISENEFVDDLRLTHEFEMGSTKHNIAIGGYFAHIKEHFGRYSAATLQDVSDNSRLLDLVALNAAGQVVGSLTQNGVTRYSSEFANGSGTSDTFAFYASDEWQITRQLRLDGGLRYEHVNPTGAAEGSATVDLGDPSTLADNSALIGNGVFSRFNRNFHHLGWTLGVDYQFTPRMGVFARYTSAFRLPGVGDFITNATATPVVQKIKLSEGGFKLSSDKVNLYLTGFNTDYSSYAIGNYTFNPITGIITQSTQYADTRTYGVEVETVVRPVHWFDLALEGTFQQPKFRNLKYSEVVNGALVARDYDGHQLLRVPKVSLRATPEVNLFNDRFHAQMDVEHYGSRYADAANTQKLPAYTVINASVRFALTPKVTLYAYGDNLNNSLGLTEGNPRSGELTSGQASDQFFIGRPILGRSFRFAAMYQF